MSMISPLARLEKFHVDIVGIKWLPGNARHRHFGHHDSVFC